MYTWFMIQNVNMDTITEWHGPVEEQMDQEEEPPANQGGNASASVDGENVQDNGQGNDEGNDHNDQS